MRKSNTTSRLLLLFSSVFLFSSIAFSSETRVATMGSVGIFVKDQSNVMLFPGTLLQYNDLVVAEMRAKKTNSAYSLGLHMNYGDMTSGLYINMPIGSAIVSTGLANFGGLTATLNNGYAFMLGMKMGGMDAGFGIITAGSSFDDGGDPKTEESTYYIGLLAGVSNDMMDLGLLIELPSITQEAGAAPKEEYSGFAITASGRYFLMKRRGASIFPVGRLSFGSSSYEISGGGGTVDFGLLSVAAGVGVEKPINENNLLIVGVEAISYTSGTADLKGFGETTTSVITLPGIYVGVESRISSWLIGRLGAAHVNQQTVTEIKPDGGSSSETTTDGSNFKVSLGLGMEFGDFLVDFAFNEGLLFDGPAIISNTGEVLASRISVTYNFGGGEDE